MKRIAVFTSGGDAPGMNACIRAVVRTALSKGIEVFGIQRGYQGMIEGKIEKLETYSVSNIVQKGGTFLKSARSEGFRTAEGRKQAYDNLKEFEIDGLVAIGGDGTFTGANIFYKEYGIPTIGCPGTIDNDLFGTDYTIGFDTAVNTALEAIDKIRDTADSHDRAFFVEVMGRDTGYIALQCAVGGGAELVMIPETLTGIDEVVAKLRKGKSHKKTSFIVVVAEGDEEGNAMQVAEKVKVKLPQFDIRVSVLGHIQRGGAPSAIDRVLASRMGMAAVNGLLAGKHNMMAGIVNDKVHYTPFEKAIKGEKKINNEILEMLNILAL